ncbi:hypothetical protein AB0395_21690 [Streptosporangium sp. NPDC051023]|uniref:hypothetical protein n=1 Tax=Streptosporangium sp. NPDC051023 TaxID=3155410 RepID=UPI00344C57BE
MNNDHLTSPLQLADAPAFAIDVVKPGYPTAHLGPFAAEEQRSSYLQALRRQMKTTAYPEGVCFEDVPYDSDRTDVDHLPVDLPGTPVELATLLAAEPDATGRAFPDLPTRLRIRFGDDDGERLWRLVLAEVEADQAHADHFAAHVKRCDAATDALKDAMALLRQARRALGDAAEEDWCGDGELDSVDYRDAEAFFDIAERQIRAIQRITQNFRAEAETFRALNATAAETLRRRLQTCDEKAAKAS